MDYFRALSMMLRCCCTSRLGLLLFVVLLVSPAAFATVVCPYQVSDPYSYSSSSAALSSCQAGFTSGLNSQTSVGRTITNQDDCSLYLDNENNSVYEYCFLVQDAQGVIRSCYSFPGTPSPSPTACMNAPRAARWVSGKILSQSFVDQTYTDPTTGVLGTCKMEFNPATPPMLGKDGNWYTYVELSPASDGVDPSPLPAGQVNNSSGQPYSPQPQPAQPDDASGNTNQTAPAMCGAGSCYDPNTGNFCALSGSGQVCVPGSAANSPQGGCFSASGGNPATVCAGSPSPPSPVGASGSQITNPATQIQSSDQYTTANPSTGALSTVTVNTYVGAGGIVSSGSTSSSVGASNSSPLNSSPASSSSSGNGDGFSGGGDCNTPPVCSGDAVMCGVALQNWRTTCAVDTETKGMMGDPTQQPPTFASDSTKYGHNDVWQQASTGNTTGDAANAGTYDQSGFGYSTVCPFVDQTMTFMGQSFTYKFSFLCGLNPYMYWVIIGMALVSAVVITAGGRG